MSYKTGKKENHLRTFEVLQHRLDRKGKHSSSQATVVVRAEDAAFCALRL